jgi:hypothetical protein
MRVYEITAADGYEWIALEKDEDFGPFYDLLHGTLKGSSWPHVKVGLVRTEDDGRRLRPSDFPWLVGGLLILRRSAAEELGGLLGDYGELLPVECDEETLWVLNVTRQVPALDVERSAVRLLGEDGRPLWVDSFAFHPEVVDDLPIFKLRDMLRTTTFVGDRFVELVRSLGLHGLDFRLLWDSKAGPAT